MCAQSRRHPFFTPLLYRCFAIRDALEDSADSTTKCNSGELSFCVEEYFVGSFVSQRRSWPIIARIYEMFGLRGSSITPSSHQDVC